MKKEGEKKSRQASKLLVPQYWQKPIAEGMALKPVYIIDFFNEPVEKDAQPKARIVE